VKAVGVFTTLGIIILLNSCTSKHHIVFSKSKIDYKALWRYFDLKDILQATIISHYPAEAFCGASATGSISIVKINNDTIRVLDLCNISKIEVGTIVKIYPAEKPPFAVSLPTSTATFIKNDTIYETPSQIDLKILKTYWGQIQQL